MASTLAKVDKDYLFDAHEDDVDSKVGTRWTANEVKLHYHEPFESIQFDEKSSRFRLKDDDGNIYYGGWLFDDRGCALQQLVLEWGAHDSGCTTIEVKNDKGEWVQHLG